jgi:hypothetical protein
MIDVLQNIRGLLEFKSDDDFYYLQILMRKKENPQLGSNSRVIKNYYIKSIDHLDKVYSEIKALCNQFNARAMLRLNKRSFYNTGFKAMVNMANTMANKDFKSMRSQYDKACGQGHNDREKSWIIDIDGEYTKEYLSEIISFINGCKPEGDKLIVKLPTKNGIHLITKPFNLMNFKSTYPNIDIHKDNPINLYIP